MTRCKHLFALFCSLLFTLEVMAATLPMCDDMQMGPSQSTTSYTTDSLPTDVVDPHAHHHLADDVMNESAESGQLSIPSPNECCQIDCGNQCAPIHLGAVALNNLCDSYTDTIHQPAWDLHSSIHPSFNNTPYRPPISR